MSLAARTIVAGAASGPLVTLAAPLSFWGGLDIRTGRVIDRSHPDFGRVLTGTVLVMPAGRGSSSSSSVLAEAIRIGTAPAAIVLGEPDPILTIGAMVAARLYGRTCPIVVAAGGIAEADGTMLTVSAHADGSAVILGQAQRDPRT